MNGTPSSRPPRIAIACPGVGLVQRGYERMFGDLFRVMEDAVDITLVKGGGTESAREIVPPFLARNGRFVKWLPLHALVGRTAMHVECMTFALGMLPHLRGGRFDIVHCIDPPLVRILYKMRRRLGLPFRLLYSHGCTMSPRDFPPADHLHHIGKEAYEETLAAGIRADSMTLLPCGIHPAKFIARESREELRRRYGVAPGTFVILSVAALNRDHKRTHHLIEEASQLEGDVLLWLDGSLDQGEPELIDHALSRLGERCRVTHVPTPDVAHLYRIADVMAHASTFEAFGLSIVEAAATGLPVITHNAPHFQWLLPNPQAWLDMTQPGALAKRLAHLMAHREDLAGMTCREQVLERFSWDRLRGRYLELYDRVAALAPPGPGEPARNFYWQIHA